MPQKKTTRTALIGMFLSMSAAFLPLASHAESLTVPITFDWNGLALGKGTLQFQKDGTSYQSLLDGQAYGLGNLFVSLTTQTESKGSVRGNDLHTLSYDSGYKLKNTNKEIHVRWDASGNVTEERIVPETDKIKRQEVPMAEKKGALDPVSAYWQLREWLAPGGALSKPGSEASIKLWDGKRLFDLQAANLRTVPWTEGHSKMAATKLRMRRTRIRGFTPEEQASMKAASSSEFYLYFCAEESAMCHDREPLGMDMPVMLGTLRAQRVPPVAAPVMPVKTGPAT